LSPDRTGFLGAGGLPAWFLLATPAFALLDLAGGPALRVAGVAGTGPRQGYYLILVILGVFMLRAPRLAPWLGMGESVVNLFLVLLSILLPIWTLPEVVGSGAGPEEADLLTPARLVNAVLAGGVFIWSFHLNRVRAFAGLGGG
jgi:hypothetical protein